MLKVSVIIPTTEKTKDYLEVCVNSLRETTNWDIIVVSNGSNNSYPLDNSKFRRVHTKDQGQCNAVNIGAQLVHPSTDYIFVSNDDMYYAPGWLKNTDYSNWPSVWSPNLVEPTNNAGSAHPFLKLDGGLILDEFNKDVIDKLVLAHEDNSVTTGFNFPFFIRKEVWNTVGGYDTKYDPWGSNSDTDLQTKIELAGIQPIRYRNSLVYHFGSKSGTFDPERQVFWQKNWDYYTAKWGFNRDMDPKPDTWMATNMVNIGLNRYHPEWEGKYKD